MNRYFRLGFFAVLVLVCAFFWSQAIVFPFPFTFLMPSLVVMVIAAYVFDAEHAAAALLCTMLMTAYLQRDAQFVVIYLLLIAIWYVVARLFLAARSFPAFLGMMMLATGLFAIPGFLPLSFPKFPPLFLAFFVNALIAYGWYRLWGRRPPLVRID